MTTALVPIFDIGHSTRGRDGWAVMRRAVTAAATEAELYRQVVVKNSRLVLQSEEKMEEWDEKFRHDGGEVDGWMSSREGTDFRSG